MQEFGHEFNYNCDNDYTPLELNIVWILFKVLAVGYVSAFGIYFIEVLIVYTQKVVNQIK